MALMHGVIVAAPDHGGYVHVQAAGKGWEYYRPVQSRSRAVVGRKVVLSWLGVCVSCRPQLLVAHASIRESLPLLDLPRIAFAAPHAKPFFRQLFVASPALPCGMHRSACRSPAPMKLMCYATGLFQDPGTALAALLQR